MVTLQEQELVLEICQAYEEGFNALNTGDIINPYDIDAKEHFAWLVGHNNALLMSTNIKN